MALTANGRYLALYRGVGEGRRIYAVGSCARNGANRDGELVQWHRYPARFLGFAADGRKVYAAAPCFLTTSNLSSGRRYFSKYLGIVGGRKLYLTYCCVSAAGDGVTVPCCPASIPKLLFATLTNVTRCPDLNGVTIDLNYIGEIDGDKYWRGIGAVPGANFTIDFFCPSSGFECLSFGVKFYCSTIELPDLGTQVISLNSCTCSPFSWDANITGDWSAGETCCSNGAIEIRMVVTE